MHTWQAQKRGHRRKYAKRKRQRQRYCSVTTQNSFSTLTVPLTVPSSPRRRHEKKREAIDHLNEYFGDMMVSEIKQQNVEDWLDGDYVNGVHARRRAYRVLTAIVKKALTFNDDEPALLDTDPCQRSNPELPKSKQSMIPSATQEELGLIYNAMPDYSRIAFYLGAVFGLRISEVCALQVCDIDSAHKLLHVRHALTRGDGDTGALSFKDTKTESSNEDLPIPDSFAPLIKEHIKAHCESLKTAMLVPAKHSNIMSPNTLRAQFDEAKLAANRPDLHFHTLRATAITTAAQAEGTPRKFKNTDATPQLRSHLPSTNERPEKANANSRTRSSPHWSTPNEPEP